MASEHTGPPVVAVFNHKGGVAKTTTACNLAVCLAAGGLRVVLIDLDSQGNATASFGHLPLPARGSLDVITGARGFAETLLPTAFPGVSVLPATAGLRLGELELGGQAVDRLRSRLGAETAQFADLVIVDCPPSFGMVTLNALVAATAVIIPTRPDPFAHEGLSNTWYLIKRMRQEANTALATAGILLTMTEAEGSLADGALAIRAEFGAMVYDCDIALDPEVARAAQLSLPVAVTDPDGLAGRAYVDAAIETLARLARHGGANAALAEGPGVVAVLNTLRDWRAAQPALQRLPTGGATWMAAADDRDAPPAPAKTAAAPTDGVARPWLVAAFAAGAALGALVQALVW